MVCPARHLGSCSTQMAAWITLIPMDLVVSTNQTSGWRLDAEWHLIEMSYCVFQSRSPIKLGQSVEPYYGLYRFERDWDLLDVEIDEAA